MGVSEEQSNQGALTPEVVSSPEARSAGEVMRAELMGCRDVDLVAGDEDRAQIANRPSLHRAWGCCWWTDAWSRALLRGQPELGIVQLSIPVIAGGVRSSTSTTASYGRAAALFTSSTVAGSEASNKH